RRLRPHRRPPEAPGLPPQRLEARARQPGGPPRADRQRLPRPSHVPPAPPRSALPRPAHGPGDAGRAAGLEEGAARLAWASRRGSTARGRPARWGPRDLGEVHAAQKLTPGVRIKGEVAAAARDPGTLAERAKALALETGFDVVGIAAADAPPELSFF